MNMADTHIILQASAEVYARQRKPAMQKIVPNLGTLEQYLKAQKNTPEIFRPERCPNCGMKVLWGHGSYDRKADRSSDHNPVRIFRFFCPFCHCTCSVLPEYISPRRWYLWSIQQAAIVLVLSGKSIAATARAIASSRHTISRWMGRLKERFRFHKDVLCQHITDLGRTGNFAEFWLACFNKIPLSQAMLFCHVAGVNVP
jgi:transposase-like protein